MRALLLSVPLLLGAGGCEKDAPDTADPSEVQASRESEELEDEVPPGHGSCCADNRCKFAEYPGRREWQQDCREKNADPGQWCSGECMLNVDTIPPTCDCL